jgi:hypothetical protein
MTETKAELRTTAPVIDRFLEAVASGTGMPTDLFAQCAVLDATVPNWRFSKRGAEVVASQYGSWFAHAGALEELERLPLAGGEVITYLLTWIERGVPHAAHHCHVLRLDAAGRIAADQFFCGGRWRAALLAEMAAANDAG